MRAQRADARQNYDTLIAAADAAFTREGADVSMHEIARRAGVGIGTLYRHFPTRNDLLARVLFDSHAAILAQAEELLGARSALDGLTRWLVALAEHGRTYSGLAEALGTALRRDGSELCKRCDELAAAAARLVERAKVTGEIRGDVATTDVVMSAHSAAWVAEQTGDPAAAKRMIDLLVSGLRPPVKAVSKRPRRATRG